MALALSRIQTDSAPLRGPLRQTVGKTVRQRLTWRVRANHLRFYLAASLAVGLVGVAVNALLFQHERRPAPLFGSPAPTVSSAVPAPSASPAPRPAEHDASPAQAPGAVPPARPAETAPSPQSDPITDLLRGETHVDGAHLILAAQTALAKLGYPVKPDGNDGAATQQALREFERGHGLPSSTEITPRLLKQLTAAARAGGR